MELYCRFISLKTLKLVYDQFDRLRTTNEGIAKKNVMLLLKKINYTPSNQQYDSIIRKGNYNDYLNLLDILRIISADICPLYKKIFEKLYNLTKGITKLQYNELTRHFDLNDRSNTGKILLDDVEKITKRLKIELSSTQLDDLELRSIKATKDDKISTNKKC